MTLDAAVLRELVRETRRRSHAFVQKLFIPGMGATGMPIIGADGAPFGALSVAAISSRLQKDRRAVIVPALQREVSAIKARLRKAARSSSALMRVGAARKRARA